MNPGNKGGKSQKVRLLRSGAHSLNGTQLPFLPRLMLQVGLVPPAAVSSWANRDSWIMSEVNRERAERVSVPCVPVALGKSSKKLENVPMESHGLSQPLKALALSSKATLLKQR